MTETNLPVDDAIDEVRGLRDYTGALARRGIGLTWVVWGLVLAGMVLSYNQWAVLDPQLTPASLDNILRLLFVPWLALGAFVTWLLWRTLGMAIPGRARHSGLAWAGVLAGTALAGVAGVFLANSITGHATSTAILLYGVGLATMVAGLAGVVGGGTFSRAVATGIGVFLFVSTWVVSSVGTPGSRDLFLTFTWLGPTLVLSAYVAGGAILAIRG